MVVCSASHHIVESSNTDEDKKNEYVILADSFRALLVFYEDFLKEYPGRSKEWNIMTYQYVMMVVSILYYILKNYTILRNKRYRWVVTDLE
jgi:hypothetical protein